TSREDMQRVRDKVKAVLDQKKGEHLLELFNVQARSYLSRPWSEMDLKRFINGGILLHDPLRILEECVDQILAEPRKEEPPAPTPKPLGRNGFSLLEMLGVVFAGVGLIFFVLISISHFHALDRSITALRLGWTALAGTPSLF